MYMWIDMHVHVDRHAYKHVDRHAREHVHRHAYEHVNRHANKHVDRHVCRHSCVQIYKCPQLLLVSVVGFLPTRTYVLLVIVVR